MVFCDVCVHAFLVRYPYDTVSSQAECTSAPSQDGDRWADEPPRVNPQAEREPHFATSDGLARYTYNRAFDTAASSAFQEQGTDGQAYFRGDNDQHNNCRSEKPAVPPWLDRELDRANARDRGRGEGKGGEGEDAGNMSDDVALLRERWANTYCTCSVKTTGKISSTFKRSEYRVWHTDKQCIFYTKYTTGSYSAFLFLLLW